MFDLILAPQSPPNLNLQDNIFFISNIHRFRQDFRKQIIEKNFITYINTTLGNLHFPTCIVFLRFASDYPLIIFKSFVLI